MRQERADLYLPLQIEPDQQRFKAKLRDALRKNLRKYVVNDDLIGTQGGKRVRINLPGLEIPQFRFKRGGSVGQGEGEGIERGDQPGFHELEVDELDTMVTDIFLEDAYLPNLLPSAKGSIESAKSRVRGLTKAPTPRFDLKSSFRESLKRNIPRGFSEMGDKQKTNVLSDIVAVSHQRGTASYRPTEKVPQPFSEATIFYLMDVSGSMTNDKKRHARLIADRMQKIIARVYEGHVKERFFVHDVDCHEVPGEDFYNIRESGGTEIAPAYKKLVEIGRSYPLDHNLFAFHFSDGEGEDESQPIRILEEDLLPLLRFFAFVHTREGNRSGDRLSKALMKAELGYLDKEGSERLVVPIVDDDSDIEGAIREILGKKK